MPGIGEKPLRSRVGRVSLVAILVAGIAEPVLSFKPKTHVWIAQQVVNDAIDGEITIRVCRRIRNGKILPYSPTAPEQERECTDQTFVVEPHVVNALKNHPDIYRIGNIGPDAFPDFVAGQITAHPGVKGAWLTDDWLKWVKGVSAQNDEARAFALGYLGHAAGDLFAHTYVNTLAGDVFVLTDGETDVERRHMAIEAYVDLFLPPLRGPNGAMLDSGSSLLRTPRSLLARRMILDSRVADQYQKASAMHLWSMNAVYDAVKGVATGPARPLKDLRTFKARLEKEALKFHQEIQKHAGPLAAARASLAAAQQVFEVTYDVKIRAQTQLIAEKEKAIAAATAAIDAAARTATDLNAKVADFEKSIPAKQREIDALAETVQEEFEEKVCKTFDPTGITCVLFETAKKVREVANPVKQQALAALAQLHNDLAQANQGLRQAGIDSAAATTTRTLAEAAKLQAEVDKKHLELTRLNDHAAHAALAAAQQALKTAEDLQAKLEEGLLSLKASIEEHGALDAVLEKWVADITRAVEEYEDAAGRSAHAMTVSGDLVGPFLEWYKCWAPVFMATPREVLEVGCGVVTTVRDVRNRLTELREKVHRDVLGETGGWIADPGFKVEQEIDKKVMPVLTRAGEDLALQIFGPELKSTADLLRGGIDDRILNDVMSSDSGGKQLLLLGDADERIRQDMGVTTVPGEFDPMRFPAIYNAVILAKLTLLSSRELNRLAKVAGVWGDTTFGPDGQLFKPGEDVLTGVLRSIDGDHQWLEVAPHLPRRDGAHDPRSAEDRTHGFGPPRGFRYWHSEKARNLVFRGIFIGPLNRSILDQLPAPCRPSDADPFPDCAPTISRR